LISDSANCTVLRAVVLTQYRHVADRRTDGRNCGSYSTALAMPALRRAVESICGVMCHTFGSTCIIAYTFVRNLTILASVIPGIGDI